MVKEIQPSSTDEECPVRQRDLLDDPIREDVRNVAAAIEEDIEVERERDAGQCLPVRGERVLLDLVNKTLCGVAAVIDKVDLGSASGGNDVNVEGADSTQDTAEHSA